MISKSVDNIEIKIFLTFFLIYLLFSHWVGWNEESRISLTKSISRENSFQIDIYANFTGDRAFYDGHYYSDKAPGTSFLATPISLILDSIFCNIENSEETILVPKTVFLSKIYLFYNLPFRESVLQILTVIMLSALPGALLVVLIYKTSRFFVENHIYSLITSFSFGLGTLIFPYSTVAMGILLASFFGFLGFYIILKILKTGFVSRFIFISGLLLGFSFVVSYLMIIVFIGLSLFLFLSKSNKKTIFQFFIGVSLGSLPLLIYNFVIFSNPFNLTMFHRDKYIFPCLYEDLPGCVIINKMDLDHLILATIYFPNGLASILFYPYRGIFFYAPFLLTTPFGFYLLYKKDKNLTKSLLLIFILFVIFLNYYPSWEGGNSFGLRYMIPIMPFLSIPFAMFLQRGWKNRYAKIVLLVLLFISVFHNFLGQSTNWEGFIISFKESGAEANIQWSTKSFKVPFMKAFLLNPLYEHYLPMFLKNGPRSRILEGILTGTPSSIDIRDFQPIKIREIQLFTFSPFETLVLKIPFLIIPILLAIITLIWRKELEILRT